MYYSVKYSLVYKRFKHLKNKQNKTKKQNQMSSYFLSLVVTVADYKFPYGSFFSLCPSYHPFAIRLVYIKC